MLTRLTDRTFHRAIQSSQPILVTFTAPVRCVHCREQKPALEAMATEYPVYLVDVEEPDTAKIEATLGGRGVPFSKVYANGQLLVEHLGKMNVGELMGLMQEGGKLASEMSPPPPSAPPAAPAKPQAAMVAGPPPGETVEESVTPQDLVALAQHLTQSWRPYGIHNVGTSYGYRDLKEIEAGASPRWWLDVYAENPQAVVQAVPAEVRGYPVRVSGIAVPLTTTQRTAALGSPAPAAPAARTGHRSLQGLLSGFGRR
jgi:thiol-disulfide isomerase/thioredoxin